MTERWLAPEAWRSVQRTLPICCVDVLPLRLKEGGVLEGVGLISRSTPHQGIRWCLIGGRMLYGESFGEAVERQLYLTLGEEVSFNVAPTSQPVYVAQYRPFVGQGFQLDPRQHAIGLTYCLEVSGSPKAQGEAITFSWFGLDKLPQPQDFGFQQDRIVAACLERLRTNIA